MKRYIFICEKIAKDILVIQLKFSFLKYPFNIHEFIDNQIRKGVNSNREVTKSVSADVCYCKEPNLTWICFFLS